MYCHCNVDYASASPNTHVCPVFLGLPGVLPTINRQAVEFTVEISQSGSSNTLAGTENSRNDGSRIAKALAAPKA